VSAEAVPVSAGADPARAAGVFAGSGVVEGGRLCDVETFPLAVSVTRDWFVMRTGPVFPASRVAVRPATGVFPKPPVSLGGGVGVGSGAAASAQRPASEETRKSRAGESGERVICGYRYGAVVPARP
jgi:hypothetical protein